MACYHPLKVWYSKDLNPSGKRSIAFTANKALDPSDPFHIPCGQCIGCRLERSRQWATRCLHESSLYEDNCFITLTFSPEQLKKRDNPDSLDVSEYQKFMKRLRKRFIPKNPYNKKTEKELYIKHHEKYQIRFFHCGEYGEKYNRPHYHAILFNFDFPDKELWSIQNGYRLFRSKALEELWPYGFCSIGSVTFESAAYVARYIMKKATGDLAIEKYHTIDEKTGEITNEIIPEYTTMSRRPGIGKKWFDQFRSDVYPKDFITINGKKVRPPKYYDKLFEDSNPQDYFDIKEQRQVELFAQLMENSEEFSYKRLAVKEQVKAKKLKLLVRNHDND